MSERNEPMQLLAVKVPPALKQALHAEADRLRLQVPDLVRTTLAERLADPQPQATQAQGGAMEEVKRVKIDRENDVIMTIIRWEGYYGQRFGYTLKVAETDPFVWALGDGLDGYVSAAAAERDARDYYDSFRAGDELCKGVFKV